MSTVTPPLRALPRSIVGGSATSSWDCFDEGAVAKSTGEGGGDADEGVEKRAQATAIGAAARPPDGRAGKGLIQ